MNMIIVDVIFIIMLKFIIDYNSPPKFYKKKQLEYYVGNIG